MTPIEDEFNAAVAGCVAALANIHQTAALAAICMALADVIGRSDDPEMAIDEFIRGWNSMVNRWTRNEQVMQ